jgi:hypothetical protein
MKKNNLYSLLLLLVVIATAAEGCQQAGQGCESATQCFGELQCVEGKCTNGNRFNTVARTISYDRGMEAGTGEAVGAEENN